MTTDEIDQMTAARPVAREMAKEFLTACHDIGLPLSGVTAVAGGDIACAIRRVHNPFEVVLRGDGTCHIRSRSMAWTASAPLAVVARAILDAKDVPPRPPKPWGMSWDEYDRTPEPDSATEVM